MQDYKKIYKKYLGIDWDSKQYEVHHIDGNRENNDISNLVLLPKKIHQRFHKIQGVFGGYKDFFDVDALHIFQYTDIDKIKEYISLKEKIFFVHSQQIFVLKGYLPKEFFIYYLKNLQED